MAKLRDLTPDASNANRGTERGRYALETSLRKYGAGRSILIDREGRIIAGNKTAETAADVGIDDVIIVQTDGRQLVAVQRTDLDLDSKEARELAYADNRVAELDLSFDPEQMLADMQAGVDLEQFWRKDELDDLFADLTPKTEGDTEPQTDRAEELRERWQTAAGQLWQLGEHRLICGDCTDAATVARVMGGERAQAVVTDPPYGMYLDTDFSGMKSRLFKGKTGGASYAPLVGDHQDYDPTPLFALWDAPEMFLWGADYYAERLLSKNDGSWLVWDKRLDASADKMYGSCFELCWSKKAHKRDIIRVKWAGIFGMETEDTKSRVHPTQKPAAVFEWIYKQYTEAEAIVTDPYVGSGTTIIACENLSRRCRAVEISPAYVAVALQRFYDHCGKLPVLLEA